MAWYRPSSNAPTGGGGAPSGPAGGDLSGTYPNPQVVDLTLSGEVQGSLVYFNGSNWVVLPPGASGQVLQTAGAGADPLWAAVGTGDVVGPASSTDNALVRWDGATGKLVQDSSGWVLGDTGILDGTLGSLILPQGPLAAPTAPGQLAWNTATNTLVVGQGLSTYTMISNATNAGGDLSGTYPNPTVVDLTLTGEVQGAVSYFNGSNWVVLVPGTSGQVLTTQGAGANPTWTTVSGGSNHATLTNLLWTSSGHTGTALRLASFSAAGAATYTQISTIGRVLINSATYTEAQNNVGIYKGFELITLGNAPNDPGDLTSVFVSFPLMGTDSTILVTVAAEAVAEDIPAGHVATGAEDAVVYGLTAYPTAGIFNSGFTIWLRAMTRAYGTYKVNWVIVEDGIPAP